MEMDSGERTAFKPQPATAEHTVLPSSVHKKRRKKKKKKKTKKKKNNGVCMNTNPSSVSVDSQQSSNATATPRTALMASPNTVEISSLSVVGGRGRPNNTASIVESDVDDGGDDGDIDSCAKHLLLQQSSVTNERENMADDTVMASVFPSSASFHASNHIHTAHHGSTHIPSVTRRQRGQHPHQQSHQHPQQPPQQQQQQQQQHHRSNLGHYGLQHIIDNNTTNNKHHKHKNKNKNKNKTNVMHNIQQSLSTFVAAATDMDSSADNRPPAPHMSALSPNNNNFSLYANPRHTPTPADLSLSTTATAVVANHSRHTHHHNNNMLTINRIPEITPELMDDNDNDNDSNADGTDDARNGGHIIVVSEHAGRKMQPHRHNGARVGEYDFNQTTKANYSYVKPYALRADGNAVHYDHDLSAQHKMVSVTDFEAVAATPVHDEDSDTAADNDHLGHNGTVTVTVVNIGANANANANANSGGCNRRVLGINSIDDEKIYVRDPLSKNESPFLNRGRGGHQKNVPGLNVDTTMTNDRARESVPMVRNGAHAGNSNSNSNSNSNRKGRRCSREISLNQSRKSTHEVENSAMHVSHSIMKGYQDAQVHHGQPHTQLRAQARSRSSCARATAKKEFAVEYELLQWAFIVFFTLIAVIDRFTLNMWPLWVDSAGPVVPGNWSVSCFTLIAWVSSRMLLVSSSYIFWFQCDVFWNWFCEYAPKWIKIGDIRQTNHRMHFHVGWALIGIPVVLHVWTILWAAMFAPNSIQVFSSWWRPFIDGVQVSFWNGSTNMLSLSVNDVYRLCTTSVCFFFLFPWSMIKKCKQHNWSLAQWIHLLASTIYTVDLIRMESHPHCWVFNAPFILWWMVDRYYGIFHYRRCVAHVVRKTHLDQNYMILYVRVPEHIFNADLSKIGDVYFFNTLDCHWDRSHPFTVFYNHNFQRRMIDTQHTNIEWKGHKFSLRHKSPSVNNNNFAEESAYIMSRQSTKTNNNEFPPNIHPISNYAHASFSDLSVLNRRIDEDSVVSKHIPFPNSSNNSANVIEIPGEMNDWNIGIIAQIVPNHTDCYHRKTWTNQISKTDPRFFSAMRCWGPYRSDYRMLHCPSLNASTRNWPRTPLVLLSTGAGCAYMIDFYQYFTSKGAVLSETVQYHFSTRSISMFQWFTDITCHTPIPNFSCNAHLTSHSVTKRNKALDHYHNNNDIAHNNLNARYSLAESNSNSNSKANSPSASTEKCVPRDSYIGRLSFEEILQTATPDTQVFFCGSPFVQGIVKKLCTDLSLEFHAGHSFHS